LNISYRSPVGILILLAMIALCLNGTHAAAKERPNVLLILVDDLKPVLGCYGDRIAKTPNLDRLAESGMRFDLAYCNQAVCAPSRFTLMLGSHSTSTGLYGLNSQLRQVMPDAVTIPQYFASYGYRTESLGKVFHIGHGNQGDPDSFSVPHFHDKVIEYLDPVSTDGGKLTREEAYFTNQKLDQIRSLPRGAAFESPDVADTDYADGRVSVETIKRLRAAKQRRSESNTPFFIVAGFAPPRSIGDSMIQKPCQCRSLKTYLLMRRRSQENAGGKSVITSRFPQRRTNR
jgi:iduronate 2-sulfatase